jgi:trk system potassium uptake protein TrkH
MNWKAICRLLGTLTGVYSLGFVPSIGVAIAYDDGEAVHFATSLAITAIAGFLLWWPARADRSELKVRDGFLLVALFWGLLPLAGAIPFLLGLHLDFTDAMFEAVSGFTTTGATVIEGLDRLPPSILYHRQQIQFLGGAGVIVLALAILPLLAVGGMELYRAEASGITKEEKLTPRIADTARSLWALYVGFTALCALAYWLAGMSAFDAIGHAYTTVSTAGFSTHDASIAHFDSVAIETICVVFMLLGGINFATHFHAWRRRSPLAYLRDAEVRIYFSLFVAFTLLVTVTLAATGFYGSPAEAFRRSVFQAASVMTTTGFATANFSLWPLHVPLVLAVLSFIGGCAGSTAGGIKVVRIALLAKLGMRQLYVLVHPNAVAPVKLGARRVREDVLYSVWGYYSLYVLTALVLMTGMMAAGLDLVSAFGAVIASLNLLGPGLGEVAVTFGTVGVVVKWLAIVGMLVGRLEVFTLLMLLTPAFWRH